MAHRLTRRLGRLPDLTSARQAADWQRRVADLTPEQVCDRLAEVARDLDALGAYPSVAAQARAVLPRDWPGA